MDDPADLARDVHRGAGRDLGHGRRPRRDDQVRLPGRRPAAELLHRPRRDPPIDPDRRGPRRGLRAPVRPDPGRFVTAPRRRTAARRSRSTGWSSATAAGRSSTGSRSGSRPARRSRCSGRTAPARRRPSRSSRATGGRDEGTVRVLGADPAGGRPGSPRARRADAPGRRRDRPADDRPRGAARSTARSIARRGRPPSCSRWSGLARPPARTRFRRLSGGERQRLGLALALVGRPELVALDEPTAGMDVEGRAATRALLGALRDEGVTVLLTSHDLADVERVADRIAILDRGRIVALGSPGELAAGSVGRLRFRLDRRLDDADLAALGRGAVGAGRRRGRPALPRWTPRPRRRQAWPRSPRGARSAALLVEELRIRRGDASRSATSSWSAAADAGSVTHEPRRRRPGDRRSR